MLICQRSPSGSSFMEHLSEFACKAGAKKNLQLPFMHFLFSFALFHFQTLDFVAGDETQSTLTK